MGNEQEQAHRVELPESQLEDIARRAADAATRKTFAILGVDFDNPESIEQFREDLRFGRRLRKAADHGFLALVGALAIAMVGLLGLGIAAKFKG